MSPVCPRRPHVRVMPTKRINPRPVLLGSNRQARSVSARPISINLPPAFAVFAPIRGLRLGLQSRHDRRRIQFRFGGGCRPRRSRFLSGHRHRRIRPHSGLVQQCRGTETDNRCDFHKRCGARLPDARLRFSLRQFGRGRNPCGGDHAGVRSEKSVFAAPAAGFSFTRREAPASFRFGMPRRENLEFFGNREAPGLFDAALQRLHDIGGTAVPIDFAPFREAGVLLFDGPWIAERAEALGPFLAENADKVLPVTRGILASAARWNAVDTFKAFYRQQALKREAEWIFSSIDVLAVPTVGTYFTIAEMEAEPVARNTMMGFYSYFVNMLDLCAIAVPSGFYNNSLPAGITLVAPAFHEGVCTAIAQRFHQPQTVTAA